MVAESDERGREAAELAFALGFADVAYLEGGVEAWSEAGYPTETVSDGGVGPAALGGIRTSLRAERHGDIVHGGRD